MADIIESEQHQEETMNLVDPELSLGKYVSVENEPAIKSSLKQATLVFCKVFFGSAIITIPHAFRIVGSAIGLVTLILVAALVFYCMKLGLEILESQVERGQDGQEILKSKSLEGIGFRNHSKAMGYSAEIAMIVLPIGGGTAVLIYFNQFLTHCFCEYGVQSLCNNITFNIIVATCIVLPLLFITNYYYFFYTNMAAFILIIIALLAQIVFDAISLANNENSWGTFTKDLSTVNWSELPAFFGICVYSFEGIVSMFVIRAAMIEPKLFSTILWKAYYFIVAFYLFFALLSTSAMPDDVPQIVIFSMSVTNPFYFAAQIGFSIAVILTFGSGMYAAFQMIEKYVEKKYPLRNSKGETTNGFLRFGIRIVIAAFMLMMAFGANNFFYFVSLMGSFGYTYLGIVYPIVIYNKKFKDTMPTIQKVLNYIILVIGITLGAIGVYTSIDNIINEKVKIE